jgi:hypothetical protein
VASRSCVCDSGSICRFRAIIVVNCDHYL